MYPFFSSGCIVATDFDFGAFFLKLSPAVPVEWLTFEVERNGKNSAKISWSTASEINNSHFEILRSNNGIDFEQISRKEKDANGVNGASYNFVDNKPLRGENYYKISQVDFDGKNTETEIKSVVFNKGFTEKLNIYPNPVSSVLNISNIDLSLGEVRIEVIDKAGRLVMNQLSSNVEESINLKSLLPGKYVVRIMNGQEILDRISFVKQ